jgi:hypothetical protein
MLELNDKIPLNCDGYLLQHILAAKMMSWFMSYAHLYNLWEIIKKFGEFISLTQP